MPYIVMNQQDKKLFYGQQKKVGGKPPAAKFDASADLHDGYPLDVDISPAFSALKLKREYNFMAMDVVSTDSEKYVRLLETATLTGVDQLCDALPKAAPLFFVYDHAYLSSDGRPQNRLLYVYFKPNRAQPEAKMLFTSQKGKRLQDVLDGCASVVCETLKEVRDYVVHGSVQLEDEDAEEDDDDWIA